MAIKLAVVWTISSHIYTCKDWRLFIIYLCLLFTQRLSSATCKRLWKIYKRVKLKWQAGRHL